MSLVPHHDSDSLTKARALEFHAAAPSGKLAVIPTKPCAQADDLALAYTPGVGEPCLRIQADPEEAYHYTGKGNSVAVISNGSAVLGLGNLGALASKPVMEGKSLLFKRFADIDSVDVEVQTKPGLDLVDVIEAISPTYGGINLEDIKAPECFDVEARLKQRLSIPVFHDDQHGTAVVIAAGLFSSLALSGKALDNVRITVNGAGAASIAAIRFLRHLGVHREQITVCDTQGVIHTGRDFKNAPVKAEIATHTKARTLEEAMVGADVFIGVSIGGAVTPQMLMTMAKHPIIFALANPVPEISWQVAQETRPDAIVSTGRSDMPNQVNNVLAFPFLFRAALDVRASAINVPMMEAAARSIAQLAMQHPDGFGPERIIPSAFDDRLFEAVSLAVARAAISSGIARRPIDLGVYKNQLGLRHRALMEKVAIWNGDSLDD